MKKLLALALALVMVFALVACGGGGGTSTQAPATDAPATEPPATDDATATEEPAGEDSGEATETLKIGVLLHTTEWFATVDKNNYNEINGMIAYVNDELGGWEIGGTKYKLEAVHVDGKSDPEALRAAAMSLVDAGVEFVVETNDFWVLACEDIFEENDIMHITAYATYADGYMGEENPMAFVGTNGIIGDWAAAFEVFADVYPDVKSIIFCNDDNGTNEKLYETMNKFAEPYGIEILDNYVMYAGDTTDWGAVALQVVNSGADCFMGNGAPDAFGNILKEVRALGSDMVCACIQGKPATTIMEYAGADASYNAFTVAVSTRESERDQNTDVLNAVVEQVRALYGDAEAAAFDGAAASALYTLLNVMQESGSTDPKEVAAAWESATMLKSLYGDGTPGGIETYGIANHAIGHPKPISIMDPEAEDGWYFYGYVPVSIP